MQAPPRRSSQASDSSLTSDGLLPPASPFTSLEYGAQQSAFADELPDQAEDQGDGGEADEDRAVRASDLSFSKSIGVEHNPSSLGRLFSGEARQGSDLCTGLSLCSEECLLGQAR